MIGLLAAIIIVVLLILIFFQVKPCSDNLKKHTDAITAHQHMLDSLAFSTEKLMEDTTKTSGEKLFYLGNKVSNLEDQYANVLNDIRQETNNHIEYVNVWLGVWVAILALVCGVAPALLQYRLYIVHRTKLREELEGYEKAMSCHEISNFVNTLSLYFDTQITVDFSRSRELISILFFSAVDSFRKLLTVISDQKLKFLSRSDRDSLIIALIQISAILERIIIRVKPQSVKRLNMMVDKIKRIVNEDFLFSSVSVDEKSIFLKLESIVDELKRLPIEWDYEAGE